MNFICKWPMKQVLYLQKMTTIYLIKDFNIIHNIKKTFVNILDLEADSGISYLPPLQKDLRFQVATKTLYKQQKQYSSSRNKREKRIADFNRYKGRA